MNIIGKILRYISRRLNNASLLFKDALIAMFSNDYRIGFRNFWYAGKNQCDMWFLPLIKEQYSLRDPGSTCRVSSFRPHLEMLSVLGNPRNIECSKAVSKIFFTGECVRSKAHSDWLAYGDYRLDIVDLAIGFDPESSVDNKKYIRFPLWILFFFSSNDTKDQVAEKIAAFNMRRYQKSKYCALIARHDSNGLRTRMYKSLSSIEKIDCAGRLLNNDNSLQEIFYDNKVEYLKQYRFNICPENTQGEGYVTEKLFQAFDSGCIPIYNGYSEDPEPYVVNKESFVFWSESGDNSESIEFVKRLNEDPDEYTRFILRPRLKSTAVDFVWESLQRLRERIGEILPLQRKSRV